MPPVKDDEDLNVEKDGYGDERDLEEFDFDSGIGNRYLPQCSVFLIAGFCGA